MDHEEVGRFWNANAENAAIQMFNAQFPVSAAPPVKNLTIASFTSAARSS